MLEQQIPLLGRYHQQPLREKIHAGSGEKSCLHFREKCVVYRKLVQEGYRGESENR